MDISGIFSESFWYIAPILITLTTTISGAINQLIVKAWEAMPGWLKQVISWVIGAGVSVGAWGIKAIEFGEPVWLGIICLCAVVGLCSNGVYDISVVKDFINKWFTKKS